LKTVLFTDKGTMYKVEFIRVFTAPLSFPEKRLFAIFTVMETTKFLGETAILKLRKYFYSNSNIITNLKFKQFIL